LSLTPTTTDPPLTWARFYRALGWIPLPIASRRDVPDKAEHATRAKRPMVLWGGGRWIAQPPTDEQLVEWWGEDDGRGIFLLTGPGSGLTVIDVDTYKGGDASPWEPLATVVANTARGGVHLYFAEDPNAKTDNDQRGRGIDIRGKGGGVVAPSGTGSGRSFVRFELPLAPYPAPAPTSKPTAPPTMSTGGATLTFKPEPAKEGSFAEVVSTTRPDGTKNKSAKEIVGMLCRRAPLPADALAAALGLLDGANEEELLRPGWEAALSAASVRPKSFVVQFILAWNSLRCDPPWEPEKAEAVAESLWRTASSSEATAPPTTDTPQDEPTGPSVGSEDTYWDNLSTSGAKGWGIDEIKADFEREPLDWAVLPGNLNPAGFPDESVPTGNGIGEWLNEGLGGGLTPGYFLVIGAKRAKGGKTAFMDQALTGLGMTGAQNYLNAKDGKPSGPIMIPFVLSEMPLKDLEQRGAARYIGCDQSIFRRGKSAHLAKGVVAWADKCKISAHSMLAQIQTRVLVEAQKNSLFNVARRLRQYINPARDFPQDERLGTKMLARVAALIRHRRAQVAQETGRDIKDIWPILFVDPLQRFGDHEGGDVTSIDVLLNGLRAIANDDRVIVIATSDTNKASASEGKPTKREEKLLPDAMVAKVTRGTYGIGHIPDAVIAIEVEPGNVSQDPYELERRALVYVGLSRWSAGSDEPFPYRYFPRSGRFVPIEPESERVAQIATVSESGKVELKFNPEDKNKQARRMSEVRAAKNSARKQTPA